LIIYKRSNEFFDKDFEINTLEFKDFVLISYYRTCKIPPGYTHLSHFLRAVEIFEKLIVKFLNKKVIFLRDFNLDYAKLNDPNYSNSNYFEILHNTFDQYGFLQLIDQPTWHRTHNILLKESIIDHIYCNNCVEISNVTQDFPNIGDHNLIYFDPYSNSNPVIDKSREALIRDWRKYSSELVYAIYNERPIMSLACLEVESCYDLFDEVLCSIFNKICPLKRFRKKEVALTWALSRLKEEGKISLKPLKENKNINELKKCKILDKEISSLMQKKTSESTRKTPGKLLKQ